MDIQKFVDSFQSEVAAATPKFENGHLVSYPGLSATFLFRANVVYFVTLAVLYLVMRNRQPLQLTNMMRAYNLTCVILAGIVCYGIIANFIQYGAIAFVGNGDRMDARTAAGGHLLFFIWLYYIQKFWEFLDSFIFILRRKWNQLSFLHMYHHASITIITFAYIVCSGSGDVALGAFINSFVHVLMYSHYLLSTFKIQLWWKPYLTQMQLIQFVIVTVQSLLSLRLPEDRGWPYFLRWVMLIYTLSMIALFGDFYIKSYLNKKPSKKNGRSQNGKKTQ